MANYTITIRTLMNNGFDFGLQDYPIFDESYRKVLNQKILYHYYENEIGFETAALFKFYLNNKMNEIMEYYNTLYKVQKEMLDKNLLIFNVNLTEKLERQVDGKTNTSSDGTSQNDSKSVFQDTPQGKIYQGTIDDMEYATNVSFGRSNVKDNTNTNGTTNSTESYIKTITGNNGGVYNIDIISKIKKNLMNIDMEIINSLNDLFMQIY